MKTAIDKFLEKAILPTAIDDNPEGEVQALSLASSELFGIERQAKKALDKKVARVKSDIKFIEFGWKRLDLKPLGWTKGLLHIRPTFSIFRIDDSVMQVHHQSFQRPYMFPETLRAAFAPALELNGGTLTTTFRGVLTKALKDVIVKASPFFKVQDNSGALIHHLYLLCEETSWLHEQSDYVPGKPQQPLLVGWDGTDLWLIESYVESMSFDEFMRREFPSIKESPKYLSLPEYSPFKGEG